MPGLVAGEPRRSAGLLIALAAAVAWAGLAARTPTSTYHFAPIVIAAAWVLFDGYSKAGTTQHKAVNFAIAGLVIAVATTLILEVKGDLQGPTFWDGSDDAPVVVEHVLFSVVGAAGGLVLAMRQAARPPVG